MPMQAAVLKLDQISLLVRTFAGRDDCWAVTNSIGSMLLFDFGERASLPTSRGRFVDVGRTTVSVLDCAWALKLGGKAIYDSETVARSDSPGLTKALLGARLAGLERTRPSSMKLKFSNGLALLIDLTNEYGSDEDILEIKLRDLLYLSMSPSGEFTAAPISTETPEREQLSA